MMGFKLSGKNIGGRKLDIQKNSLGQLICVSEVIIGIEGKIYFSHANYPLCKQIMSYGKMISIVPDIQETWLPLY